MRKAKTHPTWARHIASRSVLCQMQSETLSSKVARISNLLSRSATNLVRYFTSALCWNRRSSASSSLFWGSQTRGVDPLIQMRCRLSLTCASKTIIALDAWWQFGRLLANLGRESGQTLFQRKFLFKPDPSPYHDCTPNCPGYRHKSETAFSSLHAIRVVIPIIIFGKLKSQSESWPSFDLLAQPAQFSRLSARLADAPKQKRPPPAVLSALMA